jgi:hypothetical protein
MNICSEIYFTTTTIMILNKRFRCFKDIMVQSGFINYDRELWHYTLQNEPYPDIYILISIFNHLLLLQIKTRIFLFVFVFFFKLLIDVSNEREYIGDSLVYMAICFAWATRTMSKLMFTYMCSHRVFLSSLIFHLLLPLQ